MNTNISRIAILFPFTAILLLLSISKPVYPADGKFREKFIEYQNALLLPQLVNLVKENREIMPAEIENLMEEAMAEDKDFRERMRLLDSANAMATMHMEWNAGDKGLLEKIQALQEKEAKKEEERRRIIARFREAEKVPGNFVMNSRPMEMKDKGLSPVIFPHWVHRSFFRCEACHERIFVMKRGANNISQKNIAEGKLCGACHDGTLSFSATDGKNCARCHLFGRSEETPLIDLSFYDQDRFMDIAARLRMEWRPENLTQNRLPLDRFGFIDWAAMEEKMAHNPLPSPLPSIDGAAAQKEGERNTAILFESGVGFLKDVLFSHTTHSKFAGCSLCHPSPFKPELGANRVKMLEMKEGKSCGKCHGRVAFTDSDCMRCHNASKENLPEGVLINHAVSP